jgi:hypothetical protein
MFHTTNILPTQVGQQQAVKSISSSCLVFEIEEINVSMNGSTF